MVVPTEPLLPSVSRRSPRLPRWNNNGQRWYALAVPDYESRALPL